MIEGRKTPERHVTTEIELFRRNAGRAPFPSSLLAGSILCDSLTSSRHISGSAPRVYPDGSIIPVLLIFVFVLFGTLFPPSSSRGKISGTERLTGENLRIAEPKNLLRRQKRAKSHGYEEEMGEE